MRFFLPYFLFAASFFACKNQPKESEQVTQTAVSLPQDFLDFYTQFHRDSLYQVAHIIWPLQGDTDEQVDSLHFQKKKTVWEQDKWRMQKMDFNQDDYIFDRQMLGDMLVIESIRPKTANYGIVRRFAKQGNGEWALIYYSDLQELK
jgi:hypothetical protein